MEKGTSPRPRSRNMRLTPGEYSRMVGRASPKSPLRRDVVWAFLVGGGITGPAITNILAPTPVTSPSTLNSMA